METRERTQKIVMMFMTALLLMSCLLPGMIPLTPVPAAPVPVMERDVDKVIAALNGQDWVRLGALAEEQYTEEDLAKPGTLTYTVKITDDRPTYFSYGWCAVDEATLRQNFEHITVKLLFNGDQLGSEVIHNLSFTSPDNLLCLEVGALMSDWPAGEYQLKAVATFDQKINDGIADYEAGDYIFLYNVTVEK